MAMRGLILAIVVAIVIGGFEIGSAGRPHISSLNVLLPPRTSNAVQFRLQGYGGCFIWSWDHHDIISLEAEYNGTNKDCSTSAVISPIAPFDERQATAVHATDILTGEVLRCEVFIDKMSRIQIFHHSVKLDLDGWATLRIRAFDAEDNVFSSLVGLRFSWQLIGDLPHRLLHVPLKDSPLSDKSGQFDVQIKLEESGFGSDLYVVRGVTAGQEMVKAKLVELNMDELEDSLQLTVAEAISLEPHSPVYIIPQTRFQFKLKAVRQNVLREITLPSLHHQWFATNNSLLNVDKHTGVVVAGKSTGLTNVIVEDIRVKGHQQVATVHVVTPTSLQLLLSPLNSKGVPHTRSDATGPSSTWYLVVGREYVVHILTFSLQSGSRPLYLTQSNDLRLFFTYLPYWEAFEIPEDVAIEHNWKNSTLLTAMAVGQGVLVAKLSYENEEGTKVLEVEQAVKVCSTVSIVDEKSENSRTIFLPWSPGLSQEYRLRAEGGCGDKPNHFIWSSSDLTVASVNSFGVVHSKGPGTAVIRVVSAYDPHNADEIQVEVSVPSSISPVHGLPFEVEVNTSLPVAVTFNTPAGHAYSRCDAYNLVIQWDMFGGDGNFKFVDSSSLKFPDVLNYFKDTIGEQIICAWGLILPVQPGRATVSASLKVSSAQTPAFLEASWMVSAYAPLTLKQVSDGSCCGGYSCVGTQCENRTELLLVVGSSAKLVLNGGPEHWRESSDFVEYHDAISDDTADDAANHPSVARTAEGKTFAITCNALGKYTLVFYRGYRDREEPLNIVASSKLSVICAIPSSTVLVIDEPHNDERHIASLRQLERGPDRKRLSALTVLNSRSIRVAAVALHSSGKPYANSTSLALSWDIEDCTGLAYWEDTSHESWERILSLQNGIGLCTVRATVAYLKQTWVLTSTLSPSNILLKQAKRSLTDAAPLQLVAALRIEPKEILLFAHPDAQAVLQVIGGTTEIEAHVNDSRVVVVNQPPLGARSSQLTVSARNKGTALVSIRDVGLATPASASCLVYVADVSWVKITPDEASLQLGTTMEIHLQAGDSSGRIFHPSQFGLLKSQVHFQDDVLELYNSSRKSLGNTFYVRAANLGVTTFHVTVQQASGRELHSEISKIEVYEPLFVQPSPLILAPGAQYMITVHGGPRTGVAFEFSSSDSMVVAVDSTSGLVTARSVGNEVIVAKARDRDGSLLGQASTEVTVSVPVSMAIDVGGGQLGIGMEMSIYPLPNEGNLFSIFEMCSNYEWSTSDDGVLRLESVDSHSATSFEASSSESTWLVDAGFSARVTGRSPGRATVSVKFVCHFHVLGGHSVPKAYSATNTISVIANPPLALGTCATWVLPPAYKSSQVLPQRSSDGISRSITYSVMPDESSEAVISIDSGYIVTADRPEVSCIHAKDRVTGRTEVAVCVRVAEIALMTVGDNEFPYHVTELSVGTQQSFTVTLRDVIGTPFFEFDLETSPLVIETNRPDVVSARASVKASSVTIVVQALRQGKALIRISQRKKPGVADYILVLVGASVFPRSPTLHVGGRANFSIVGKGLHSAPFPERGQWSSGNDNIVRVNGRSGEAEAVGPGVAVVSFNGSRLTAYTPVTVIGVSSVSIESPKILYMTNVPFPDQGSNFPVKFKDTRGSDTGVLEGNQVVLFDCRVTPSFVGHAAPMHDRSSGSLSCVFFPFTPEKIAFNLQKELKSNKAVKGFASKALLPITVTAFVTSTPDVAGTAEATFAGGFSIIDTPHQLQLSPRSNKTRIMVVGPVGSITTSWRRKDAINVELVSSADVGGYAGVFQVDLLKEEASFSDKLVFVLTTTGQREEVGISYEAGLFPASIWQQVMTVLVVMFVCIALPLFICSKIYNLTRMHTRRDSSRVSQVVSDDGSSGGILVNNEPNVQGTPPHQFRTFGDMSRTPPPQPYTEYVSRTIQQTPYLYRGGTGVTHRHVDPSKTY